MKASEKRSFELDHEVIVVLSVLLLLFFGFVYFASDDAITKTKATAALAFFTLAMAGLYINRQSLAANEKAAYVSGWWVLVLFLIQAVSISFIFFPDQGGFYSGWGWVIPALYGSLFCIGTFWWIASEPERDKVGTALG